MRNRVVSWNLTNLEKLDISKPGPPEKLSSCFLKAVKVSISFDEYVLRSALISGSFLKTKAPNVIATDLERPMEG